MKIIKAKELFQFMDEHRFTLVGKSQIERFVQDLDDSELNDRKEGYKEAVQDMIDILSQKL